MDRIVRYAAYAASIAQIIAVGFVIAHAYRARDFFFAGLGALPAVLFIAALVMGPDLEERRLRRDVAKLRLRAELRELEEKTGTK